MKKILILVGICLFLGCGSDHQAAQPDFNRKKQNQQQNPDDSKSSEPKKRIGGQRDEHACLTPGGYTWCEAKQKCLRAWEEQCE
ncbi:MAG: hypothetical protein GF332_03040 [Candidatus Moranbacteria bacterium]|nr:hypothetical protein [Candidatus Moranbacteria bacterium]